MAQVVHQVPLRVGLHLLLGRVLPHKAIQSGRRDLPRSPVRGRQGHLRLEELQGDLPTLTPTKDKDPLCILVIKINVLTIE